ncbi:MAG: ParB N-terminal domain-containing protein [Lachnospiraceae bacterium]|nr:ParB N-terminal domain-containing protein [Lachnospiraceae bacterium]
MIKLVPIKEIQASEYNPRRNDEKRLALTELSLRKLGFLLPIYADTSGEILSGHQRCLVASRMGYTRVPVEYVDIADLNERKTVNILFNRATNDLHKQDTCGKIKNRLYNMDIEGVSAELPDIEPDSEAAYPCMHTRRVDTVELAKKNHREFDGHIKALAKTLEQRFGVTMPIVVGQGMNVINGIGRLQVAAEAKRRFVKCVQVSGTQEELAAAMLNLLSMDFSMESSYADVLRYNSFMRERNTRETDTEGNCALGDGFFKGLFPNNNGRDFFKLEGETLTAWVRKYGNRIVDFGAGKLNNTRTLRNAGIFVSAFEPYFVTTGDEVHKEKSIEIAKKFLDDVERGVEYTSVFISSVFNSVPFMADRIMIARIAAALCAPSGRVVCWCQSNQSQQFIITKKHNITNNSRLTFDLDYEPNTVLGDISKHPKVQKGHTKEELTDIFERSFRSIDRIEMIHLFWYLEASRPVIDLQKLGEALDFEFELPYPDGTTMGLSQRAREAFEKRLGAEIPRKEAADNGE